MNHQSYSCSGVDGIFFNHPLPYESTFLFLRIICGFSWEQHFLPFFALGVSMLRSWHSNEHTKYFDISTSFFFWVALWLSGDSARSLVSRKHGFCAAGWLLDDVLRAI